MAILKLEDLEGLVELLVFPKSFQKVSRYILLNSVVLVRGVLNLKEDTPKIIVNDLFPMDEAYRVVTNVKIDITGIQENLFESLKNILEANQGQVPVFLHVDTSAKSKVQFVVGHALYINPSARLIQEIEDLLGEGRISLTL